MCLSFLQLLMETERAQAVRCTSFITTFVLFTAGDLTPFFFLLTSGRKQTNGRQMRTDFRSQSSNETKKLGNSSMANVLIRNSLKMAETWSGQRLERLFLCQDQARKEGWDLKYTRCGCAPKQRCSFGSAPPEKYTQLLFLWDGGAPHNLPQCITNKCSI